LLSSWNVTFEAIDTELHPEAKRDLERFGIPRVPAVVVGDRAVHGWNPRGVADLVGVAYEEDEPLTLVELVRRLDTILSAAQRAVCQVPREQLLVKTPGRDRTVHQLGYHLFRVALSYRETMEQGYLSEKTFEEGPPPGIDDGASIADYGQTVRATLAQWFQRNDAFAGEANTYYGTQTAHDFFERTVWHTAQHLRQLYALLESMGITPEAPLTQADFRGLPLPQNVW
jgi:hypothetical protein